MNAAELSRYKDFATLLARESAKVILPYFAAPDLKVDEKSDHTPVTAADRGAEMRMRELIAQHFPTHGILGEEFGEVNKGASFQWVLDPVDGTKSFTANNAQFGTLICLLCEGKPLVGVINLPATGQLLLGDGESATLNGRTLRLREPGPLSKAIVCTTDLADCEKCFPEGWAALKRSVRRVFTWGDCYGYYLVASGGVAAMCDPVMNAWDLLPLIPVLRGAGAKVTGWDGGVAETASSCVAAHPSIHGEIISLLNPQGAA
jgi:myo-inositol-1(or 4)-monophosphatase